MILRVMAMRETTVSMLCLFLKTKHKDHRAEGSGGTARYEVL